VVLIIRAEITQAEVCMIEEYFSKGGVMMYPLLFFSVVLTAVFIERLIFFIFNRSSKNILENAEHSFSKGDFKSALSSLKNSSGAMEKVAAEIITHINCSKHDLEHIAENRAISELQKFSRGLHIMDLIGRISPMIGLSGTVLGMVKAFQSISAQKGAVDPSVLAGGIWESLLTTVFGLMVGIPALIIFHIFENELGKKALMIKLKSEEMIRRAGACGD
jgi:biopolymer transport protein ExbB